MTHWMWAILLKPVLAPVFFSLLVAPAAWLLYRLFPEGRVKAFLFKVRTGPHATKRDEIVYTLWALGLQVGVFAFIAAIAGRPL